MSLRQDPALHTQLATSYLDRVSSALRDPQGLEDWKNAGRIVLAIGSSLDR